MRVRAAAIVIHRDQLLLMWRQKNALPYYVFPGGTVEPGETAEAAVVRELSEETTIETAVTRLLYAHNYDDGSRHLFYLCRYLSGQPVLGEGSSEQRTNAIGRNLYRPLWLPLAELPRLLLYPLEIRDWLVSDLQQGWPNQPRTITLRIADLREAD